MPPSPDDYDYDRDRDRRRPHGTSPEGRPEGRKPRQSQYYGDAEDDEYPPQKEPSRRDGNRRKYDDDHADRNHLPSKVPDAPSATHDPRDIESNMKVPRRDRYAPDDASGHGGHYRDEDTYGGRPKKPTRRYSDDDNKYAPRSAKPRAYPGEDDDDYSSAPRRANTVRDKPRRDRGDRGDRRRDDEDRYNSSYDDLPRRAPPRDYDDRDRGYKSDGRDARRRKDRDDYSDDHDRGYKSGGGRRPDPYDDRDRDRYKRSDRDRDRDRDRKYRSDDDHRPSRRGYESDRGGYRSERDRDRYYDDGGRGSDRRKTDRYYDDDRDRNRDRDRDRDRDRPKKKGGFNFDTKNIPKYIEQGQKHYHTYKPLIDQLTGMVLKK